MTSVSVSGNAVTGTLNYVTGYTGYSGEESEQSGNYLALLITSECADTITATMGTRTVTLDSDGILIIRVTDKTKPVEITASKDGRSYTRKLDLSGLTLAEEE